MRGRSYSVTGPGLAASFDYDCLDRRADKAMNGTPRSFRYDGDDLVNDTSGTHTRWTLLSPVLDEPLAQYDPCFPNGRCLTPTAWGAA